MCGNLKHDYYLEDDGQIEAMKQSIEAEPLLADTAVADAILAHQGDRARKDSPAGLLRPTLPPTRESRKSYVRAYVCVFISFEGRHVGVRDGCWVGCCDVGFARGWLLGCIDGCIEGCPYG